MSENIKNFLLAKKKKNKELKTIPQTKEKPAEKNIIYDYIDSISYNLIESMTMFKNKEINKNKFNLSILGNLSILMAKGRIDKKKVKNKNKNNNNEEKNITMANYGIYFPIDRITFLSETTEDDNNDNSEKKTLIKRNNFKFPFSSECIKTFFPLGINFLNMKYHRMRNNVDKNNIKDTSCDMTLRESNTNSFYQDSNDNSISLISEESLSNTDLFNLNNINHIEFNDSNINTKSTFKYLKRFNNYKELIDYIECPLIDKKSFNNKYNNFIELLDEFNNLDEYNDVNHLYENLDLNEENDIYIYKTVCIDNFDIINKIHNLNMELKNKNNITYNNILSSKSLKLSKHSNKDDLIYLNNSIKNDISKITDKNSGSFRYKQNQKKIGDNINIDKSKEISSSLKKKYLTQMNEKYISLIHSIYMGFISKCEAAKHILIDNMNRRLFTQSFKNFLFYIGICNKKLCENIVKSSIFSNKFLTFDQFIQCFDTIIFDNSTINLETKFIFLLNIVSQEEFISKNKIKIFLSLLECKAIYIQELYELIGQRLVIRYNATYKNDEETNIMLDKYRVRKMKVMLESFLDQVHIEDD